MIPMIPLAILALPFAGPAWGQAATGTSQSPAVIATDLQPRIENERQIYELSQFVRFAPQTALDMVSEIPGFSITALSADRGLGEASQNVLINGQRITGTSNDAQTALSRIPASSVVRLEIADAATLNISGINGQVVNVVTKTDKLKGNFVWRARVRSRINPMFSNAEVGISGKLGKGDFSLGLSNSNAIRGGGWGPDITRNVNGDVLIARQVFNYFHDDRPRLSGTYSLTSNAGSIFNANAALEHIRTRRRAEYDVLAQGQLPSTELSTGRESGWKFEGGVDYEFALGGGRLKLVGFHRNQRSPSTDLFRSDFTNGAAAIGERFDQVVGDGETVLRSEYRWKGGAADWQVSLEGAHNYFDRESELFELANGNFEPQDFAGATARVEEKRAQAITTYARPLSNKLSFEASLGGEYSQLSQTSTGSLTRSFFRPKGSVALTWKPSSSFTLSSKLQRKVGQLSFGSFLASVDLQNNNDNAANPRLVPPQSWLWESEANWSLGKIGSIKFQLLGEQISDVVDQIAISPTTEAVGNLPGIAKRLRGEVSGTFVLDSIGFNGAKLDLTLASQKTRIRDALLIKRPLSNRGLRYWNISFRHDIPGSDFAWGFSGEDDVETGFYRLNYQSREVMTDLTTSLYVEHKNLLGLKVRATAQNLLNQKEKNLETFYVGRRNGPIDFTRNATFEWGTMYRLTLSGTF